MDSARNPGISFVPIPWNKLARRRLRCLFKGIAPRILVFGNGVCQQLRIPVWQAPSGLVLQCFPSPSIQRVRFKRWNMSATDRVHTIPMNKLVLPYRVVVQLVDKDLLPVRLPGVLFQVTLFARQRNNFSLGPFASDPDGLVAIPRSDIDAEVASNYDSDLMGHSHVNDCTPVVEIRLLSTEDIARAVWARTTIWTSLSAGERDRWNSIEQLLTVYRNANNAKLCPDQSAPIRDDWERAGAEYAYDCVVVPI